MPLFASRIRAGVLEGSRWTFFAGNRYLRGTFEPDKTRELQALLGPGDVFWDVGSNMGYFAVMASRIVGEGGKVLAFEPSPINWPFLLRNLALNGCANVEVKRLALGSQDGTAHMNIDSGRGTHKVAETGASIQIQRGDSLLAAGAPAPTVLKIDVEGHEMETLAGMEQLLGEHRPKLLIAVHSPELDAAVSAKLTSRGYRETVRIAESKGDIELVWLPD